MIVKLIPGKLVQIDGLWLKIAEVYTFHDVDSRLDLARLSGETPAHSMWLAFINGEVYISLLKPLSHNWLSDPQTSITHEGKDHFNVFEGSGFCVTKNEQNKQKDKDGRCNYILFLSSDGEVILTIGQNFETSAFAGCLIQKEKICFLDDKQ